jgi:predicted nucleic acid-binding protein
VVLYADSSALMKCYIDEDDSDVAAAALSADPVVVTSWITLIEVRRNLHRILGAAGSRAAKQRFEHDVDGMTLLNADERIVRRATQIAELLGVRSLDAIHLGSAQSLQIPGMSFVTFDLRQAMAARSLGFSVLGV